MGRWRSQGPSLTRGAVRPVKLVVRVSGWTPAGASTGRGACSAAPGSPCVRQRVTQGMLSVLSGVSDTANPALSPGGPAKSLRRVTPRDTARCDGLLMGALGGSQRLSFLRRGPFGDPGCGRQVGPGAGASTGRGSRADEPGKPGAPGARKGRHRLVTALLLQRNCR